MMKSTVPVGTGRAIRRDAPGSPTSPAPSSCARERAVKDFMEPDRVVIGAEPGDEWAADAVAAAYEPLGAPIVRTDVSSAEMIKLASNAFLATKISFINEIANVCEEVGADVTEVARGMGMDERIGPRFLQAGIGYGGSCFPKDAQRPEDARRQLGLPLPAPQLGDRGERAAEAAGDREADQAPRLAGRQAGRAARPRLQARHRRHARGLEPGARLAARRARGRRSSPTTRSPRTAPASSSRTWRCRNRRWRRSTAPTPRCWSPSGRSSPSSTGPRSPSGWATPLVVDGRNFLDAEAVRAAGLTYEGIGRPSRRGRRAAGLMQALILAGGEGTRLRPLTYTVPKPVLPLAGRPHIAYVIDWLARHGSTTSSSPAATLPRACARRSARFEGEVAVRYAEEPEPRGTAGAIRFAEELLGDRFLVLNGDVLCDLDLSALIAQHERTRRRATIALYPVEDPSAYGLVRRARRRRDHRVPREARPGRDRHRRDQRRRLRARALGAGPDPAGPGGLDRARGVPAAGRRRPLRHPSRGLLDRHRDPRALPPGELGHPRGAGRDGHRPSASTRTGCWSRTAPRSAVRPRSGAGAARSRSERCARRQDRPRAVLGPDCAVEERRLVEDSVLLAGCRVGAEGERPRRDPLGAGVEVAAARRRSSPASVIGEGETVAARLTG